MFRSSETDAADAARTAFIRRQPALTGKLDQLHRRPALVGPAQVGARLIEFGALRLGPPLISARLSTILHPLGAAAIALFGAPAVMAFAVLHGAGNGLLTIARGTLPLAIFGPLGYGLRTGILAHRRA